jgi:AAA15 family ATPase/GTPase
VKLEFQSVYKSIKSLKPLDLPNFTVLTGVNGSGKTQLLEAVTTSSISIDGVVAHRNQTIYRLFNWNNLIPNNSEPVNAYQLTQERNSYWAALEGQIATYRSQLRNQVQQLLNQKGLTEILGQDISKILLMSREELLEKIGNDALVDEIFNWIQENRKAHDSAIDSMFSQNGVQYKQIIEHLRKNSQK